VKACSDTNCWMHLPHLECKVAREVVGGSRGPIVIIVEVIQCKVDYVHYIIK
jgi:hypothetical protein